MMDLEIKTSDQDITSSRILVYDDTLFIEQSGPASVKQMCMFNLEEAKQLQASLSAFIAGKLQHKSDCALHNSPAFEIQECNCI